MCTGLRKGECLSATWANVDFTGATYKVAETADFKPKDREEGIIPIPDSLVELLRARKARYPKSHRIFEMHAANPEVYLLKAIKRLAFKAGLNCGECSFKASKAYPHGRSCATSACCRRFITHKFRKTFATLHAEAGVPVPSISRFLRHSKLDTTLAYLASGGDRSEAIRSKVNNTFADLQIKKAAA
jgi:integrase